MLGYGTEEGAKMPEADDLSTEDGYIYDQERARTPSPGSTRTTSRRSPTSSTSLRPPHRARRDAGDRRRFESSYALDEGADAPAKHDLTWLFGLILLGLVLLELRSWWRALWTSHTALADAALRRLREGGDVTRTRLRMILVLAGILPTLVALLFAVKVVAMLSHDRDGRGQFDDAEYVGAADEFSANDSVNWFEPWIAAFDEGAARHADGDLEGALELYVVALEDVPAEEECTVRINMALAHETLGDTALENGDADEATAWWQAGIDALAEGGCPTDSGRGQDQTEDAAAVDQRLRDKLQQQQQQQQQDEQQQQQDDEEQTPEERREQRQQERKESGSRSATTTRSRRSRTTRRATRSATTRSTTGDLCRAGEV